MNSAHQPIRRSGHAVCTHEEVMGLTIAPAEITGHMLDGPVERISGLGRPGVTAFAAEGGFVSDAGLVKGAVS